MTLNAGLLVSLLVATLQMATPLILAGTGGLLSERSGVMHIALEGLMITGAFTAAVATHFSGSPWIGLLAAMASGTVAAGLHGYLSVYRRANQVVVGAATNLLAVGLASLLLGRFFGMSGRSPMVERLPGLAVPDWFPGADHLGRMNAVVLIALVVVPLSHWLLFRSVPGLWIQATGEHPKAADTVGIDVQRVRFWSVVSSGPLAALAGGYLAVGELSLYVTGMTAGRGFIALAAVIFGKWTPLGMFGACLLFGAAEAAQMVAQAIGLPMPRDLLIILPYLLTVVAVSGYVGRAVAPTAIGKPYTKQ